MPSRRHVLAGASGFGCAVLAGCLTSGGDESSSWPQGHRDAGNTGASAAQIPDDPTVTSVTLRTYPVTSAAIRKSSVVLGLSDRHIARSPESDGLHWSTLSATDGQPTGTPALGEEFAFVTEGSHSASAEATARVRALDIESGTESWSISVDDRFALSPTLDDDVVYVRTETSVLAIAADDGARLWSRDREPFDVEGFDVAKDIAVAVDDDRVYVPNPSGISAHDKSTGKQVWDADAEKVRAAPVVSDDVVLASGVESGVTALDTADGTERWTWHDGGMWTSPVVANDTVYATGSDLVALDFGTGAQRWRYDIGGDVFASPVTANDQLVLTSTTSTTGLERGDRVISDPGDSAWSAGVGSMFTPAVGNGRIAIPTLEESLVVLG